MFEDFGDKLIFEPLLCVASVDDGEARALIAGNPRLFSASYRAASLLSRENVLGVWLALALLGEPLAALVRHGADLDALLAALASDGKEEDLDAAAADVARQMCDFAKKACFIDLVALEDLLAYHLAIGAVGRKCEGEPSPVDARTREILQARPGSCFPGTKAPWQALTLRTPLPRLLEGALTPGPHPKAVRLLVAKIAAAGTASYYTRRSSAVETFTLDETAALVLPLCDGRGSLAAIAGEVASRTGQAPRPALQACIEIVGVLLDGGVLELKTVA
jgi:hypothetical protein